MPLYDFECTNCQKITEHITGMATASIECPMCSHTAVKIISASGINTANDDAQWIRSVVDVVDKKSKKPWDVEFRKNPTRKNLRIWMNKNNLRHLDPGEKAPKPWKPDAPFKDKMMRRWQERNAVSVRG